MRPLILLVLASCGSSPPGEGTNGYMCMGGASDASVGGGRISVSISGGCAASDITSGKGTKLEGEACTKSEECRQICCSCAPQSSRARTVVWCANGKCATKEQTCCDIAFDTACAPK